MRGFGKFLIVIGVLWGLLAFSMDTSIEVPAQTFGEGEFSITTPAQRVNNLGLMNDKQNYIIGAGLTLVIGVLLYILGGRKEENEGNVKTFKTLNKDVVAYQIKNQEFEDAKNNLLKQYEPLGYKLSLDLPNLIKLDTDNSYLQLKYNQGNNNLTLETLNTEVPNITKEISIPEDSTDKLLKLSDMLEKGLITQEEFTIQKNLLLQNT